MNIKAFLKMLAILAMVLVSSTGLYARGTMNGSWISNAKVGGSPDVRLATNAGQLSANFVNASGVTNFASLMGGVVTTKVTQGFDMSVMLLTTSATQPASAGGVAHFTMFVTNWGNSSAILWGGLTNRGSTSGWSNQKYVVQINGVTRSTNNSSGQPGSTNIRSSGSSFQVDIFVYVPTWMPDNGTNAFEFRVGNQSLPTPGLGDNWPGPLAIFPSTTDTNSTGGSRDWQGHYCLVRVSGPILKLSKTVNLSFLKPYEQMIYTVFYTNAGTAIAQNVVVQDVMPTYTTNLTNTRIWTNGSTLTNNITPTKMGKRALFNIGNVSSGQWGRIFFAVQVK